MSLETLPSAIYGAWRESRLTQRGDTGGTSLLVAAAHRRIGRVDPAELARAAGFSLFDFAACVHGGRARMDASWAGDPARLALEAHALDRDDLHPSALVHPGGIVWPAVVCSARGRHVSGTVAAEAVALGYEVCIAVARLLGSDGKRFWHVTALAGTVGAAAAAAWIESGPAHVVAAVGHAFSIAGGSITCMLERSDTRFVHRAQAASAGVLAARAASAGLEATRFGIESAQGFLAAVRSEATIASVTGESPLALAETAYRLHPASGFAQSAIDAAEEIGPIPPRRVTQATIEVSPGAALLAGAQKPTTDAEAWWSIPHAVGVTLAAGKAGELESGLSRDAEVMKLVSRCSIVASRADLGARVTVELSDGARREAEVAFATGHPLRPLTDTQRIEKWELLSGVPGDTAFAQALALGDAPFSETVALLLGEPGAVRD